MQSCEYAGQPFSEPRSHPWTDTSGPDAGQYFDLKSHPELIRTALEDLVPWSHYAAVTGLYELLEDVNAPGSLLESNDCAFSGPEINDMPQFAKVLQCQGRVMVLYRDLARNLEERNVESLKNAIHVLLAQRDQEFEWGMVGTSTIPVRYRHVPDLDGAQHGHQLMLSFWAWGDTEAELMQNLSRLVGNLAHAVKNSSRTQAEMS
ncbi:MAG: hypothetical protein ACI8TX_003839 [Hyphomicrobiaceae bacterium]|jgi:hypothetical protein